MWRILWRIQLWRWVVLSMMHRGWLPDAVVYRSGAMHALQGMFQRAEQWDQAGACQAWLRQYERSHIMGS